MKALALALGTLVLAGCASDDRKPAPRPPAAERTIRDWVESNNRGDYERAARFFARGAVVEQTREIRLRDRDAAESFNRSLPCRATLTSTEDAGSTTIGTFRLRPGRGGPCEGLVRVRFTIEAGRFTEWRQLQGPSAPPGQSA